MNQDTRGELEPTGERSPKRLRMESPKPETSETPAKVERQKGVVPVKAEYLIQTSRPRDNGHVVDDDAAEAAPKDRSGGKREKQRGQNKARNFGSFHDLRGLCSTRATQPEFSPLECSFGEKCRFEHDLRKYLKEYKREDLSTFEAKCPVWETVGSCPAGWRCRFAGSHSRERETNDGRTELILVHKHAEAGNSGNDQGVDDIGIVNSVNAETKLALGRKKYPMPKSDQYLEWMEKSDRVKEKTPDAKNRELDNAAEPDSDVQEHRAEFVDSPLLPSEKRRVYFGPDTPALAPLTTQGNLPFRRLCVELGAQLTYSEMALGLPLIQGHRSEWALMKAHRSELEPPRLTSSLSTVQGYDNGRDLKFGAQIAGNKPWNALKATEAITTLCPHLRVVDLNCGCPIDLIYRQGAGSALLDSVGKLEKILHGMNAVSGVVPVTVKIRMGTRDNKPTAQKLVDRLVYGVESGSTPCGVAAITLHGRSRQQRYSRSADWEYIASCAAIVNRHREKGDDLADTVREADARYGPNGGHVFFLGNGDCYSHVDYQQHLDEAKVDTVMVARGALIKPWIFEEIETGQYLDKSASERLDLIEKYVRYGLEAWGSDEVGVGHTRRFLLEWLSFTHRYVPVGILEHLPPNIQDRPPAWRGRNELETLLGSENFKDWIKISEMFLGPAGENFKFQPKHKSSSYEIEAEG